MNATAIYIAARIAKTVKYVYERQAWYDHKPGIVRTLVSLSPDKPNDGIAGFLSYDVDGHKRMKMRTGRFLTRKLKLNDNFLPDTAIQIIATQINTKLFSNTFEIRLDKGQQITENYQNNVGGSSCMCNGSAVYTKLYENNPDRFQMLVMVSINDTARAIVHKLDNGQYHMSRIYATSEELKVRMTIYAREKGWYYQDRGTRIDGERVTRFSPLVVSNLDYIDGEIPYMDTLRGYRIDNDKLTILHTQAGDYFGICESTCGELEDSYICDDCGEHCNEDDILCEDDVYYCRDCHAEHFTYCENCNYTYPVGDCTYIESTGISVCIDCLDNYSRCDDCDEYFTTVYSIEEGNKYVCIDCLDNYSSCDDCDEYFEEVNYIDEWQESICDDCLDDIIDSYAKKDCEGQKLLPIK